MTKITRKLPAQSVPVSTGGVQFGEENPGVYFTAKSAAYCATTLEKAIPHCPELSGLLPAELQSIADMFWQGKPTFRRNTSLHSELAKQVLQEAIGVVESVNAYLSDKKPEFSSPKAALKYQTQKIIEMLEQLQQNS